MRSALACLTLAALWATGAIPMAVAVPQQGTTPEQDEAADVTANGEYRGVDVSHYHGRQGLSGGREAHRAQVQWNFTQSRTQEFSYTFVCRSECSGKLDHSHPECQAMGCPKPNCEPHAGGGSTVSVKVSATASAGSESGVTKKRDSSSKFRVGGEVGGKAGGAGGEASAGYESGESSSRTDTSERSQEWSKSKERAVNVLLPKREFGHFAPPCSTQKAKYGATVKAKIALDVLVTIVVPEGTKVTSESFSYNSPWVMEIEVVGVKTLSEGQVEVPSELLMDGPAELKCGCQGEATTTGGGSSSSPTTPPTGPTSPTGPGRPATTYPSPPSTSATTTTGSPLPTGPTPPKAPTAPTTAPSAPTTSGTSGGRSGGTTTAPTGPETTPRRGGGGGEGGPTGPTGPEQPQTPTAPGGQAGGPAGPAGPNAPVGPAGGKGGGQGGPAADGGAVTTGGTAPSMEALVNAGSIGAGDRFTTAITVTNKEEATKLSDALKGGEYVLTQNGTPVPYNVIPAPKYAAAFGHDPGTTIYVETTAMPTSKRAVRVQVEKPASEPGGTTEVVTGTDMFFQSRSAIFLDPASGQATIAVTSWEPLPGATVTNPQFTLTEKTPTPGTSGTGQGPTVGDAGTTKSGGSGVLGTLADAGIGLVTAGAGYYIGTLTTPTDPGRGQNPVVQQIPTQGTGATPTGFVGDVNNTYTPGGYNSIPTGQGPSSTTYVITNVAGSTGVLPSSTTATADTTVTYTPAFRVSDIATVTVTYPTGALRASGTPPPNVSIQFVESGVTVSAPPATTVVSVTGGCNVTFTVPKFLYQSDATLAIVASDGTITSAPVHVAMVVTAKPVQTAATTAAGGSTTIQVEVTGAGQAESWQMTVSTNTPSAVPTQPAYFGEGSGVFPVTFTGEFPGTTQAHFDIQKF